jgi:7-cyano-7-deazaguanine synthase
MNTRQITRQIFGNIMNNNNIAVVLLSGGMDSATVLAIAREDGHAVCSLAFDYGQRHAVELELAAHQARVQGVLRHLVLPLDLRAIGGSALTDDLEVPKDEPRGDGVPVTYVPARNAVFLSLGLAWAEVLGARALFLGANQVDFSGYPDCREEFLQAFERMANLATRMGTEGRPIRVLAPLLHLGKADIIRRGLALGVDYAHTLTCYDPLPGGPGPGALACGRCAACRLRLRGFAEAGWPDPAAYQAR